ncbi:MAG: FmdB family zinc ribbon protein [Burkholderiales bacterium]
MPTYEYRCRTCGEVFEVQQSLAEKAKLVPPCPQCKGAEVEQRFTTFYAKTAKKS